MTFGEEPIQSAQESLAIAEGKAAPAAIYIPEIVDVAAIRKHSKLARVQVFFGTFVGSNRAFSSCGAALERRQALS